MVQCKRSKPSQLPYAHLLTRKMRGTQMNFKGVSNSVTFRKGQWDSRFLALLFRDSQVLPLLLSDLIWICYPLLLKARRPITPPQSSVSTLLSLLLIFYLPFLSFLLFLCFLFSVFLHSTHSDAFGEGEEIGREPKK